MSLAWTATSGATSYTVLRDGTAVGSTASTTFSDSGLTAGTTYSYTITATNTAGTSPTSTQRASSPSRS